MKALQCHASLPGGRDGAELEGGYSGYAGLRAGVPQAGAGLSMDGPLPFCSLLGGHCRGIPPDPCAPVLHSSFQHMTLPKEQPSPCIIIMMTISQSRSKHAI